MDEDRIKYQMGWASNCQREKDAATKEENQQKLIRRLGLGGEVAEREKKKGREEKEPRKEKEKYDVVC